MVAPGVAVAPVSAAVAHAPQEPVMKLSQYTIESMFHKQQASEKRKAANEKKK